MNLKSTKNEIGKQYTYIYISFSDPFPAYGVFCAVQASIWLSILFYQRECQYRAEDLVFKINAPLVSIKKWFPDIKKSNSWYQKIKLIFLYQKIIFLISRNRIFDIRKSFSDIKNSNSWYQKLNFWYQKMICIFWYQKIDFWYQKIRPI